MHCGISTELKFHEFVTKPDGVALMPTSHECEDEECVDGTPISPATVYVHVFRTFRKKWNTDCMRTNTN